MSAEPSANLAEKPITAPLEGDDNMSVEENKAVVRRWIAARNTNDVEAAAAEWDGDWQDRIRKAFDRYTEGFTGIHITIEEMVAEGDKVVAWGTFRGTHTGHFAGVPATGKTVEVGAVDLYTVVDGKIASVRRQGGKLKEILLSPQ
jgi:predicted ester cyclase